MPDRGAPALYRLRGFMRGVNWRPTRFAEGPSNYLTCRLCQVLPRNRVLLPCCEHALCECCYDRTLEDGRRPCPFDGETFEEDECHKFSMAARKMENLKAHCWNELQGCDFVGTLQCVLQHYEEECRFHAALCPRCSGSVLSGDLPAHYAAGCSHAEGSSSALCRPQQEGDVSPGCVPANGTSGVKALLTYPYDDQLPALETRVNELTEQAIVHQTQLQEITVAFEGTLHTLNAELHGLLDKFSATVGEALLASQRAGASAFLEQPGAGEGDESARASPVPWRKEKKSILRNLELMVSGAVRSLELIRECAVARLARHQQFIEALPSVILEELPESPTDQDRLDLMEYERFRCILTLVNPYNLGYHKDRMRSASAVFGGFRSRNLCFAVHAARARERSFELKLVFTWAGECEVHTPMPRVTTVKIFVEFAEDGPSLSELHKEASAASSRSRIQVFYNDGSWTKHTKDDKLQFEIKIEK